MAKCATTRQPYPQLAEEWKYKAATIRDVIKEARERKLLTPNSPGRAGGERTSKAKRLLAGGTDSETIRVRRGVSTEDQQDPASSKQWQRSRAEAILPPDGVIVAEYFDIGQSRSLPWKRRPESARLLADLARPDRGFERW